MFRTRSFGKCNPHGTETRGDESKFAYFCEIPEQSGLKECSADCLTTDRVVTAQRHSSERTGPDKGQELRHRGLATGVYGV